MQRDGRTLAAAVERQSGFGGIEISAGLGEIVLYRRAADGGKRIADDALVAMTRLIAESRPDEKELLTHVLLNLIKRKNP
jgi:hypothetical protein